MRDDRRPAQGIRRRVKLTAGNKTTLRFGTKIEAPRRIRALGVPFGDTGKQPTLGLLSLHIPFRRVGAICL